MDDLSTAARPLARSVPAALLLLLGCNWGFTFSLAKIGAEGGVPPIGYALWQAAGASAILFAISWARGHWPAITPRHLRYYAVSGVVGIAIPNVNIITVVGHLPVGVVTILVTLAPLVTWVLARISGQEPANRRRAIGTLVGFCGALLIVLPRASLPSPDMAGWVLVGLITPTFYAIANVYVARARPPGAHSLTLAAMMNGAVALILAPLAVATGSFYPLWPPFLAADYAILGHMAAASLGSLVFFEIMRMAGPVFLSQVGYIVTITGLMWGIALFGERHSAWIWAALAIVLVGLALVTWPARKSGQAAT
jgi:drug/metabolite transporter (DMT)-like permease